VSRNLWGITYGGDLEVPTLGLEGWFHKTDGAYKSLGAAVDTNVMDWGAAWKKELNNFDIFLSYTWQKDNIPDILFSDILPLFGISSSADPTEYDISNISHLVDFSIGTPAMGSFGDLLFTYSFDWTDTNASVLAAKITDDAAAAAAILNSTYNDGTMTNTAGLKWKSGRLKFGKFVATLGAATEDSNILKTKVDGVEVGSMAWKFKYGLDGSLQYDRYKVNLGFKQGWGTEVGADSTYGYDLKLSLLKSIFDTLSLAASCDQTYANSSLKDISLGGVFSVGKRFGILNTNASAEVNYFNSLVDDTKDALTASITITGGISL
jgi:hypothetical protein